MKKTVSKLEWPNKRRIIHTSDQPMKLYDSISNTELEILQKNNQSQKRPYTFVFTYFIFITHTMEQK